MNTINWKRSSLTGLLLLLVSTLTQAQQISSNDNRQVEKIHKEVFYAIRQSDNNLRSTTLREVAEFIQKHEDAVINVVGYADKGTGTPEQNVMYARQRAEKFKDDLVKQFNVDGSRIITDSKGDAVQPFAENDKNRCVIIDGYGYVAKPVVKTEVKTEQRADDYAEQQRRQYQEDRDRRYAAAMGRVDTVYVERIDTVWMMAPADSLHPETPFGLNKCNRWNNWFVQIGAGAAIYQGDHNEDAKWGDRLYTVANFSIGKWFYPALGVRAGVDLDMVRMMYNGAPTYHYDGKYNDWLNKMAFNAWNFRVDALFNLSSLFWMPTQKRYIDIVPYAGLGLMHVWDEPDKSSLSLNAGVMASVRLARKLDLTFDLRLKKFDDDLNWYEQGRSRDGITNLTVGLTWYFSKRGF